MKFFNILRIILIIGFVITVSDILFRIYEISFLKRIADEVYVSNFERRLFGMKIETFYWIDLIAKASIIVLFIVWLFPVYKIMYREHSDKVVYSPKWTIWGFIIPIANFFIPYRIMTDLWQQTYNRTNNYSRKNDLVSLWWVSSVITVFYSRIISAQSSGARSADEVLHFNYHYLLIDLIYVASVVFMIQLVKQIEYTKKD